MDIVRGDLVEVITGEGRGAKLGEGQKGKVLWLDRKARKIIVENVNITRHHQKPSQQNPQGGIIEKEMPIDASNVMLVSPRLGHGVRVRHQRLEDGSRVRVCTKTGEVIPPPTES